MKKRELIVYIALGFIGASILLALYFFIRKPDKITSPILEKGKRVIVFKDVKYSGEKRGVIDWEIRAKTARKFIDKPVIELDEIEGQYNPKANVTVFFKGTKGMMDTEEEKGNVENVDILYKDEYRLQSRFMEFDFKKGITSTSAPVDIKSSKLTLRGVGLTANTKEETVRLEKDVTGSVETDKGKFKFESDKFTYILKDNIYILDGKVIMKGEDMNLLCDKLYLFSKYSNLERIDAKGKVRLISKGTIAKSEKAVYHFKEDRVVLTEAPRILKDNVEMEGESIVYTLSNGRFSINRPKMRVEK
ncbi:MAG: LPS export ABC transporter periplasmic protein LptC [Proteobacteria bacterium]|nr:LPS export ABC transporter periplasmic protein LptC [Pseudomonadota bacterium]